MKENSINNIGLEYIHLLNWYRNLKANTNYHNVRFKKLNVGYPKFTFPQNLLDEVELKDFILSEQNRISLFIGSQMGLYPKIEEVFNEVTENKTIAVLSKSLLSGAVSGLKIYTFTNGQMIEVVDFKN
ncbi:MAG: hypothetical protein J0L86_15030 [Flavobacteriales bacterium]|nr:hypothetical protein [Flavobacteriales bacterium]